MATCSAGEILGRLADDDRVVYTAVRTGAHHREQRDVPRSEVKIGSAQSSERVLDRNEFHNGPVRDLPEMFGEFPRLLLTKVLETGAISSRNRSTDRRGAPSGRPAGTAEGKAVNEYSCSGTPHDASRQQAPRIRGRTPMNATADLTRSRTRPDRPAAIAAHAEPPAAAGRMGRWLAILCLAALSHASSVDAQQAAALSADVRRYVRIDTHKVILEHVQVIDGTGGPPRADQNLTIESGRIAAISAGADQSPSESTSILDLRGYSVMPGIVGMHNHLFYLVRPNLRADYSYDSPALFLQMSFSAPRLYLANGVTTMRTVGSANPNADLRLRRAIEKGAIPGPHLEVTGPFLDGPGTANLQMQELAGPEDARQTVMFWADRGVTSFKAYRHITRDELSEVVKEAHKRGLKVTGHLCSVTYEEAAAIGIDSLEHGFFENTGLAPDRQPDTCSDTAGDYTLGHMAPGGPDAVRLIATLIKHHVAVTSTLPGTAAGLPELGAAADGRPWMRPAALQALSPSAREAYLYWRNRPVSKTTQGETAALLRREMDLEREFVAAGGLLVAGADPVGSGGVVPGFGDQREIELLVEAGFAPVEAIRIATLNGAVVLGRQDQIGTISVGKNADLVVMKGDPASRIADIENVEIVFKDGVGYDSTKLLDSVRGRYGEY